MESVPQWFIIALVITAGLVFGSFVTLASYRLPRDEPVGAGRSRCPSCRTKLGVMALFPVFSWLAQKGRCRYCKARVSARYPLTELAQALLFLWVYSTFGIAWQALFLMLLSVCLLIMILVDLEWQIIPDEVQLVMLALGIVYHIVLGTPTADVLWGFGIGTAIGLSLHYGYSWLRGMEMLGFGDVKFLMVAGLWMASAEDWAPYLFLSGVVGIVTALVWKAAGKGERFPFGPALAIALLLMLMTPVTALFFWTVGGFYR